ncbi:FAD:protein FMN transferase [Singulisphaera sp. PoT]|uniref:FAD:protein FMN transferase n=1 Tax=Singulisphaera sp. PoT TaxID=3411797 RepID=UPI003BF4F1D6
MSIKFAGRCLIVLALGCPGLGAEPAPKPSRFEFAEPHMGSEFKLVLYTNDEATARRASRKAFDRIAELDNILSDYNNDSELMRLCEKAGGAPVPVSPDLFDVLSRSVSMYEQSEGAFDITVAPVVRLWRRARREIKLPTPDRIAQARALVGSDQLKLDPASRTVQLRKKGMRLDAGGIGKGYAAFAAIETLKKEGYPIALVAGSGDIAVGDPPPGRAGWTIGVAPLDASSPPKRHFLLANGAVSTSGDAEKFVEIDGKRYSHIVDPRTGIGVIDRCSVTVVAPDGGLADSLDTAVYVLGPERGLRLVESIPNTAAMIVRRTPLGDQTFESSRWKQLTPAPSPATPIETPTIRTP